MFFRITFSLITFFLLTQFAYAQKDFEKSAEIDVLHYKFNLVLNDQNDIIKGQANIDIRFLARVPEIQLDLVAYDESTGKGMKVSRVIKQNKVMKFSQNEDQLKIQMDKFTSPEDTLSFTLYYEGIPADGLIISENKYGDRTFFGDNWPNRARHWLPTVDHPSDKASVEFIVTAPDHYQVIANGYQYEETNLTYDLKLTHWKETVAIPTKVMVIGVARFAVNTAGFVDQIPVTSWVYRQDREDGFSDYKIAIGVLDYFYNKMGSYPFEKLANVQSKTRYGGMENAGNIFYFENSVNGKQDQEKLIAHEIAHQWFGNSASEMNWHHIWLSEGFATYLTDMYLEEVRGREAFLQNLKKEKQQVITYAKQVLRPIVDIKVTDYNELLNPNSYQKGAWVLHMLRREIGDELFWKGMMNYYQKYAFSNAVSEDFQKVMEETSGKDLDYFFKQWLYQKGHPVLKITVSIEKSMITIQQTQVHGTFDFPLEFEILNDAGDSFRKTFRINQNTQTFSLDMEGKIQHVVTDPDSWLLFEETY